MQVSEPQEKEEAVIENNQTDAGIIKTEAEAKATNTPAGAINSQPDNLGDAHKILEEAEELFNEKDYSGTLYKLEEANNIVKNVDLGDKGEVKGVSGEASSTQETF